MKTKGRVWKFSDDINTDLIFPGKYMMLTDVKDMALHAMEGIDKDFSNKVQKDDIVVGGKNFGCGSSREQAPVALKYAGVGAVIAESFARIFYRNAINIGLPALQCTGILDAVNEGDILEVDVIGGIIENNRTKAKLRFTPLPDFMVEVLNEGGLVSYIRKNIDKW